MSAEQGAPRLPREAGWYQLQPFTWDTLRHVDYDDPANRALVSSINEEVGGFLAPITTRVARIAFPRLQASIILQEAIAETFLDLVSVYRIPQEQLEVKIKKKTEMEDAHGLTEIKAKNRVEVSLSSKVITGSFFDILSEITESSRHTKSHFAYLLGTIAHEMYHVRQFVQDPTYFRETPDGALIDQKSDRRGWRMTDLGERGADATAIRYLKEKRKLLVAKRIQFLRENKPFSLADKVFWDSYSIGIKGELKYLRLVQDIPFHRRHSLKEAS